MDWFHCNRCFCRGGTAFSITSCGHILCEKCVKRDNCTVCRATCKYLILSENLKPQEKMYFKGLKETAQKYFDHIGQVWNFQKQQNELLISFYKKQLVAAQTTIQEATSKINHQEKELMRSKKENIELKSLVNMLKSSLSKIQNGSRSCTPRPIAVTSPTQTATPRHSSQHSSQVVSRSSSQESIPYRVSRSAGSSVGAGSGNQIRTTPMLPMNISLSPSSGHGLSYRIPASSSHTPELNISLGSASGQRVNEARARGQSSTLTPTIFSADLREEGNGIPGNSLRPIQLRFTPRQTLSYQSQTPSSLSRDSVE
ncbi:E3 ubiquitin-protein ligase RNF212B isoform X2 [Lissotriton helveticus]